MDRDPALGRYSIQFRIHRLEEISRCESCFRGWLTIVRPPHVQAKTWIEGLNKNRMSRIEDQLREQDLVGAFVDLQAVRAFVEQSVPGLTRKRHIFAIERSQVLSKKEQIGSDPKQFQRGLMREKR